VPLARAVELGTSHQLLAFYLRGLDEWQRKDYERRAEDIRDRAVTENRLMAPWEESQVKALERATYLCMIDSVLQPTLKRLEADSKTGTLSKPELRVISFLAQRGVAIAQKILQKHRNNLPARSTDRAKSFRMVSSESGNSAKMPSHAVS
jgi:DNA polymerase I-like protein with 3'-5' exonuclease and polymerase domains